MSESPLVTIGIPVYNVEPYIEKCLLSVLNQTYQNLEILVIDDCGTDNSIQIVCNLQSTHPNGRMVKIIKHESNKGLGEARNTVINHASGKYVYFIDSDDYIETNAILLMLEHAERNNSEVTMASLRKVVLGTGEELPTLQYSSFQFISGKDAFANYVCQDLRWHVAVTACNTLFLLEFLNKHHLRFAARKDEDSLFLSDYYSEAERVVLLPDITYNYLIRPGSIMGNQQRKVIPVSEIRERFKTDEKMTERCSRLRGRSFYDAHCARVMKHKFRAACVALRHRKHFTEWLPNEEICRELKHPATLSDILKFKRYKLFHLSFFIISKLPPFVSVGAIYAVGKLIKWI
jgi:glycosyltransferase involved in cell wall biosynthesis